MNAVDVAVAGVVLAAGVSLGWMIRGRQRRGAPPKPGSEAYYRWQVRRLYPKAFELHRAAILVVEPAIASPRMIDTVVRMALDMLITQSYKTHYAVSLLVERGQIEDAATMTRRMLELGVQSIFIGSEPDATTRNERAGAYLAHLWRSARDDLRPHLPPEAAEEWQRIYEKYEHALAKTTRRWGPNWFAMFEAIGRKDTYEQDYSFLSAIAHGSVPEALLNYSSDHVEVRSHHHAPTLLLYSTRYYMGIAGQWNEYFGTIPEDHIQPLLARVNDEVSTIKE